MNNVVDGRDQNHEPAPKPFCLQIRSLLEDTEKIPRALVFIGRNMNLVRANNKIMGSLVNRVHILATYAAIGKDHNNHPIRYSTKHTLAILRAVSLCTINQIVVSSFVDSAWMLATGSAFIITSR